MYIIGAGYTGLIAGILFPHATILEARPKPFENHQALLRFRTGHIGDITHSPFLPVNVLKTIWYRGTERLPSPRFSNLYSNKVTGKYINRSIDNIDPVTRYIAPTDFYQRLLDQVGDRIEWGVRIDAVTKGHISCGINTLERLGKPILSTIPLGTMSRACSIGVSPRFSWLPISTYRAKIKTPSHCFYTAYYPDPNFPIYRASITKDLLIMETMEKRWDLDSEGDVVCKSLGLDREMVAWEGKEHIQKYGKIAPINNRIRKQIIYQLTNKFGVYSLGRFGTWRNLLLDDVLKDILKIRKLVEMDDYELRTLQI